MTRLVDLAQVAEAPAQADADFMTAEIVEGDRVRPAALGLAEIDIAIAEIHLHIRRHRPGDTGHAGPGEIPAAFVFAGQRPLHFTDLDEGAAGARADIRCQAVPCAEIEIA